MDDCESNAPATAKVDLTTPPLWGSSHRPKTEANACAEREVVILEMATAEGPVTPDQNVREAMMVAKAAGKAVETSAAARAEVVLSGKVARGRTDGGCEGAGRGGRGDGPMGPPSWEPLGE